VTPRRQQVVIANAAKAAAMLKRKFRSADVEELTQEAVRAQLEAAQHYDPGAGTAFEHYAWSVAARAVLYAMLREALPVTIPALRARKRAGREAARAVLASPRQEATQEAIDSEPDLWHKDAGDAICEADHRRRVRERVRQVLQDDVLAEFALGWAECGGYAGNRRERPRAGLRELLHERGSIEPQLEEAKKALAGDPVLRELWEESR